MKLFDVSSATWRSTEAKRVNDPTWSRDSAYVYFNTDGADTGQEGIFRLRAQDGMVDHLLNMKRFTTLYWAGLAPDDSPLILCPFEGTELYVLDLEAP